VKIASASGKGGAGKTTFAVNTAYLLSLSGYKVQFLDLDVEEPDGHISLEPEIDAIRPVKVFVPSFEMGRCSLCASIHFQNTGSVLRNSSHGWRGMSMEGLKEVAFLSGKGGKTSVLAGIYSLMDGRKAIVDCDVDTANLFLVVGASIIEEAPFYGSRKAEIGKDKTLTERGAGRILAGEGKKGDSCDRYRPCE
jgi:MinD superfamily P-loop ATPase